MHLHRRPLVFDRFTYVLISLISAVDILQTLAQFGVHKSVQAATGWAPNLAAAPLFVVAILGGATLWAAAFIVTKKVQKSRSTKAATAHGFCAAVLTSLGCLSLMENAGLGRWLWQATGWPRAAASLLVVAAAVLLMFLLWRLLFRAASTTADGQDPLVALEFLILIYTAITFTALLHHVVHMPWWSSTLLGVGGSAVVWLPWLHAWRGERHAPIGAEQA